MSQLVYTDESLFCCGEARNTKVWRSPEGQGSSVQRQAHPQKVMVWGMISRHGCGSLVPVIGTLKKEGYVQILEENYLPQVNLWESSGGLKLLHDGAPCHKEHLVTFFLETHGVQVVKWPGNSPDMNPIENVWAVLKKKVQNTSISTKEDLWSQVKMVWEEDSQLLTTAINSIESMPNRILALIRARGGHTKY